MYNVFPRIEGLLRSSHASRRWLLVILIAALPCLDLLAFTWGTANTMITRDQWHFMPMIRDYFTGHFQAFSLWETHSQHRTPGYKLLFLINGALFGLNMRLEIMLGVIALTTSVLLLMTRFLKTLPAGASVGIALMGLSAIAVSGFNLNQWADLIYALTALAGYAGVLCFVWLWLMLDTQLRLGTTPQKMAWLCLALVFTLMAFAGGMGPALIVTLLLVPAAIMFIERRVAKEQLTLLGLLLLCSIVCELVYWETPGIKLTSPHAQSFMEVFMQDPAATPEYVVLAFASSVIPADAMDKHFHGLGHVLNLLTGAGVICLYAICTFGYLRLRMWKASYLPGFLMVFSTLFTLSTLIVRLPSNGLGTSEAPRYVLYSQLGYFGCLWILFHWLAASSPSQPIRIGALACFTGVILLYVTGLSTLWGFYPYVVHNNGRMVQEVLTGDFPKPDGICPSPELCKEGQATLAQYHLNVFAAEPSASVEGHAP